MLTASATAVLFLSSKTLSSGWLERESLACMTDGSWNFERLEVHHKWLPISPIPDNDVSISTPRPIPHTAAAVKPALLIESPSPRQGGQAISSEHPKPSRSHSISQQYPSIDTSISNFPFAKSTPPHLEGAAKTPKTAGKAAQQHFPSASGLTEQGANLPLPHSPPTKPTAPIAIPQRKIDPKKALTPLSGRPKFFDNSAFSALKSYDRLERPSTPLSGRPRNFDAAHSPAARSLYSSSWSSQGSSEDSLNMSPRHSSHISNTQRGPPSPLSSATPIPIPNPKQDSSSRNPRRPPQGLNLSNLPRFHPANFPNADANAASPSRNTFRNFSSQSRANRPGSDAQQKLQQYQRDYVANLKRTANQSQSTHSRPESPRLLPCGSPGGSMTPLLLEAQSDYLMAGSRLPSPRASNGRELVEKLVQKENERRQHPETGSVSPAMSPISPAVNPAGGG